MHTTFENKLCVKFHRGTRLRFVSLCMSLTMIMILFLCVMNVKLVSHWTIFCDAFLQRYDDACHIEKLLPATRCRWVKSRVSQGMSHWTIFLSFSNNSVPGQRCRQHCCEFLNSNQKHATCCVVSRYPETRSL